MNKNQNLQPSSQDRVSCYDAAEVGGSWRGVQSIRPAPDWDTTESSAGRLFEDERLFCRAKKGKLSEEHSEPHCR